MVYFLYFKSPPRCAPCVYKPAHKTQNWKDLSLQGGVLYRANKESEESSAASAVRHLPFRAEEKEPLRHDCSGKMLTVWEPVSRLGVLVLGVFDFIAGFYLVDRGLTRGLKRDSQAFRLGRKIFGC